MTREKINLSENHRRSLTSTLMIVEQLLVEMEDMIKSPYITCCQEIKLDIEKDTATHNLRVIAEARKVICNLTEKYNTEKSIRSLQRIIDVKKTRIWEILYDSRARKLKGFGDFPKELIKEFDKDIDELLNITSKIKY